MFKEEIPDDPLERVINIIGESLLKNKCRFFIGAGIPENYAGLPGTKKLLSLIKEELISLRYDEFSYLKDIPENASYLTLDSICELFSTRSNKNRLVTFISTKLDEPNLDKSFYPKLKELSNLITYDNKILLNRIYTTNYDLSIEREFGENNCLSISPDSNLDFQDRNKKNNIFHLHGYLGSNPEKWILTERDKLDNVISSDSLVPYLHEDFRDRVIVYLGFSFSDFKYQLIHYYINKLYSSSCPYSYILLPINSLESDIRYKLMTDLLEDRHIKIINIKADVFLEKLFLRICILRNIEVKQNLIREYAYNHGFELQEVESMIFKAMESIPTDDFETAYEWIRNAGYKK